MKFFPEHWVDVLFVVMIMLSALTHNKTLGISLAAVLVLRWIKAVPALELLADKGISWAIMLLCMGFLAPVALGRYELQAFQQVFLSPVGWISIAAGIAVAIFGAKGVAVGQTDIVITMGVIAGTVVGVAFFKGNPVGPLIGAGMSWTVISILRHFLPL